ncbi:hypothetical protein M5X11_12290 [Paenibacillus alginolyticus]|uniref:hypothetical protein n=1 Tax=Paenibacillus alginolyticus TaxID=59839 RepID=UPI000403BEA3|nr:hypothetical protein [Paenibacillus alginolyticus]MCY9665734.1 hypothetical protein [Paenibacillus alginolyticus]
MILKRVTFIFLLVYGLIGVYFFGSKISDEKPKEVRPIVGEMKIELDWDVANEVDGNYRTPLWLRNDGYKKYVDEVEGSHEAVLGDPEFTSAYQLMSLIAQLQLGDPTIASSFVSPYLSHSDYDSKKVADITEKSKSLADRITKNESLAKVKISPPIQRKDNEVSHDVILQFKNGEEIKVQNIPMVMFQDDHGDAEVHDNGMWYMNFNLQELAQRVEKKE